MVWPLARHITIIHIWYVLLSCLLPTLALLLALLLPLLCVDLLTEVLQSHATAARHEHWHTEMFHQLHTQEFKTIGFNGAMAACTVSNGGQQFTAT